MLATCSAFRKAFASNFRASRSFSAQPSSASRTASRNARSRPSAACQARCSAVSLSAAALTRSRSSTVSRFCSWTRRSTSAKFSAVGAGRARIGARAAAAAAASFLTRALASSAAFVRCSLAARRRRQSARSFLSDSQSRSARDAVAARHASACGGNARPLGLEFRLDGRVQEHARSTHKEGTLWFLSVSKSGLEFRQNLDGTFRNTPRAKEGAGWFPLRPRDRVERRRDGEAARGLRRGLGAGLGARGDGLFLPRAHRRGRLRRAERRVQRRRRRRLRLVRGFRRGRRRRRALEAPQLAPELLVLVLEREAPRRPRPAP